MGEGSGWESRGNRDTELVGVKRGKTRDEKRQDVESNGKGFLPRMRQKAYLQEESFRSSVRVSVAWQCRCLFPRDIPRSCDFPKTPPSKFSRAVNLPAQLEIWSTCKSTAFEPAGEGYASLCICCGYGTIRHLVNLDIETLR